MSNEFAWQVIQWLVALIFGSGISGLIFFSIHKRKEAAIAKQQESIADQERENAKSKEIENTKGIIEVYKKALDDTIQLYETRITDLNKSVSDNSKRLSDMSQSYDTQLSVLKKQVELLTDNAIKLKRLLTDKCSTCDFRLGCRKYEHINSISDGQMDDVEKLNQELPNKID